MLQKINKKIFGANKILFTFATTKKVSATLFEF